MLFIVIHLFKPDARSLYGLEKMWGAELDEAVILASPGVDPAPAGETG